MRRALRQAPHIRTVFTHFPYTVALSRNVRKIQIDEEGFPSKVNSLFRYRILYYQVSYSSLNPIVTQARAQK